MTDVLIIKQLFRKIEKLKKRMESSLYNATDQLLQVIESDFIDRCEQIKDLKGQVKSLSERLKVLEDK
jgi:ubiquinone biosynthesis protein UbiJ